MNKNLEKKNQKQRIDKQRHYYTEEDHDEEEVEEQEEEMEYKYLEENRGKHFENRVELNHQENREKRKE